MFGSKLRNIIFIVTFLFVNNLIAQNEAFHGGEGDGFGLSESGAFNLSEVGFEGNNLSVTVNQSGGQTDPTDQQPILFTVIFSEAVTDFNASDVNVSGSAQPQTINVSGSGTTYTVELSNVIANGNIIVQIPSGGVHNSVGNPNLTSTSTDNSVTYNGFDLSVEINLATGQKAVSNLSEVHFLVEFSEAVADFANSDVVLTGTANASVVNVTGSGTTYDVAVSGMTDDGTVVINIPANSAHNGTGVGNTASVNTQNTITCDYTHPHAEISLANGQTSPSPAAVLRFLVSFSEEIVALESSDIQLSGTAGATDVQITQNGNDYTVSVSGMTKEGTVIIVISENAVNDLAGNGNTTTMNTENEIVYGNLLFTEVIKQHSIQDDPTNGDVAIFDIEFNRVPTDFDVSDILISGNTSAGLVELSGSGINYQLSLSDFTEDGTVTIDIDGNTIHDSYGRVNEEPEIIDNEITIDNGKPGLEISLPMGQSSPSNSSSLIFEVTFTEDVVDFNSNDVLLSGTAGANSVNVTGSGSKYYVQVSGMSNDGSVVVSIPAEKCTDLAGNFNLASQNIGNQIAYDITKPSVEITQATGQEDPATTLPLKFHLEFSEKVSTFNVSKISFGGSAGVYLELSGMGTSYDVTVFGVTHNETIKISLPEGGVSDFAGNNNLASINTDNSITYIGTTGIHELENENNCLINFYQNMLHVNFEKSPDKKSELAVYSLDGKLLCSKKQLEQQNSFSMSNVSPVLLVKVMNGNQYTSRLIVTN
ncbi:MAG: hypothetical protein HC831_16400 [Chloroflexia bacterium]|nr:hypothetical protein [Chloroflexia bacterium]